MKQAILSTLAFLAAFLLPLLFFVEWTVDAPAILPLIVCPVLMAAAAWYSAGKEKAVTKWVLFAAAIGLLYGFLIHALN